MTIRSQIIGSFLLLSGLFVAFSYVNYRRSLTSSRQLFLINELYLPLSRMVVQMQVHVHGLAEDSRRLQSHRKDLSDKGTFSRMVRDLYPYLVFRKIDLAEGLIQKNGELAFSSDRALVTDHLVSLRRTLEGVTQLSTFEELEPIYQTAKERLAEISRVVDFSCQKVTGGAQEFARDNLKWTSLFSTALSLVGVISLLISSRALRPLPKLIENIKQNAAGETLTAIKVSPQEQNELSVLAREYNKMLLAIAERDRQILSQQKELVQSERLAAIGKLSAEIVHEIRNPLNSISLNIDWLSSEWQAADPEIQKTLASLSKEVIRLNEITERYLVQARVSERSTTAFDINELLRELVEFLKEENRTRKIGVSIHLSEGQVMVNAEKGRIRQAFLNVLRNSRDAMPKGGEIVISSRIQGNTCEVTIEDSGCGMSDTTLHNVFRPFFSTKPNGNGLGLMLTRSVVEQAHGSLSIKSKMGIGTQCQILFPACFA